MKPRELAYFAYYGFETLVLHRRKPIVAGIALTDVCNLQCRHCVVANVERGHYPFSRIEQYLEHFYRAGARIVYLQGGEIMTWHDGSMDVNDVIRRAKEIGFFKVAAVTNGTMGISNEADLIWVSLDGSEPVHDSIRGKGTFAKVMRCLEESDHPHISLNMTINRLNAGEVERVASIAKSLPKVRGVSFNFHVPYPEVETIFLPLDERARVIDRILELKRQGYPVLNSRPGLKALKENRWHRPLSVIQLVEQDRIYECCWGREHPGVCDKCGYGVIAEMSQIFSGNISAAIHSLSLFK
jgi:MoaA/NifB/PqqE/SkfB family radical SAM enzyme